MSAVVVGKNNTYGTIIMLHGLGDSGAGWQPIAEHFEKYFPLKWILPNAPSIAVTLNFGMEMPAWYDIYQLNTGAVQDAVGMGKSVKVVHDFIDKEIQAGVPPEKIFVGGFSQGGAVALLSGLRYSKQLGGILALSTYLPLYEKLKNETLQKNTPIFMAHGEADQVVNFQWGKKSSELLQNELGCKVTFKSYRGMGHSTVYQELEDIRAFLRDECKVPEKKK